MALREEVRRLADDVADRDEMRAVREQMAELAPSAEQQARGSRGGLSSTRTDPRARSRAARGSLCGRGATLVDPQRLGDSAGRLDAAEMQAVDEALRLILAL